MVASQSDCIGELLYPFKVFLSTPGRDDRDPVPLKSFLGLLLPASDPKLRASLGDFMGLS